jgi:nicotinamide-nucleotide amidase
MDEIERVVAFLADQKILLVTAESCTAGLVSSLIADVPGSGAVLQGGWVVYAEQAKQRWLGVNPQTIAQYGLTSEEVAREMVLGALRNSSANLALAITGKAESDDELDGVMCIAYGLASGTGVAIESKTTRFEGERNTARKSAARHVILNLPAFVERQLNR